MIGVDKIEDIRKRARGGEPIASIARAVGASEPTVRKYARMEDLSPEPPRRREPESEVLAPYEGTIDSWLDDDCRNWRKQRHTATRVYVRLRDEEGYAGSYSTVQRCVKRRREEMARERDRRDAEGFLTLRWLPGEVQVDFGGADFRVRGETKWNFFSLFLYSIDGIVAFSTVPLSIASVMGIPFCLLALVGIVFIVIRTLMFGDPVGGWPSLVCVIALLGGIQLLCLGILGQHLSKTYLETKRRPIYIVRETDEGRASR